MFSLFQKRDEKLAVIFDVGNGSVAAALVKISKSEIPRILSSHREPLAFLQHHSHERFRSTMFKMLRLVAKHVSDEAIGKNKMSRHQAIDLAACFFCGPWQNSNTSLVFLEQDNPFVVNGEAVDGLIEAEQKKAKEALEKSGNFARKAGEDIVVLDRSIIDMKLNGYTVADPIGKKARQLEFTLFSSFIASDIVKKVEQEIRDIFHVREIKSFSYTLASWSAARVVFPDATDFLFLDVTSESTDVVLTAQNVIQKTASFPSGRAGFLKEMVDALLVSPGVAVSFLRLHNAGKLEGEFAKKVDDILLKTAENWFRAFTSALTGLSEEHSLPKKVFITADEDMIPVILPLFKKNTPFELAIPQNIFDAVAIDTLVLKAFCRTDTGEMPDPFLSLESVFLKNSVSLN